VIYKQDVFGPLLSKPVPHGKEYLHTVASILKPINCLGTCLKCQDGIKVMNHKNLNIYANFTVCTHMSYFHMPGRTL